MKNLINQVFKINQYFKEVFKAYSKIKTAFEY